MSTQSYLHGIGIVEVVDAGRPIRTVASSVIGLVGTAGKGPVNTPTLIISNSREAVQIFGQVATDGFTIPQALDDIFKQAGAMVVVINVLNPEDAAASITNEFKTFVNNKVTTLHPHISTPHFDLTGIKAPYTATADDTITLPTGCTRTGIRNLADTADILLADVDAGDTVLVVYSIDALTAGIDYTVDLDTGLITRLANSKLLPGAKFSFDYDFVDPTFADESLIIGGIENDGSFTGIEALAASQSTVAVKPRILIATGWTQVKPDPATASAVATALRDMGIRLRASVVLDAPNTTKEAAVLYLQDFGDDDRVYVHYPNHRILNPAGDGTIISIPASARVAGLMCRVDNDEGFWVSPSNHEILGILGVDKPVDFDLSSPNTVANYLNAANVTTTIHEQGFRLWGNRVANGTFLTGRRIADLVEDSITAAHLWAVDRNITKGYVEAVVEGVNDYIRVLKSQGAILGGKAWCDPQLNTDSVIALGELFIDFEITRPTPAENLTFRVHFTNNYVTEIFDIPASV